MVNVLVTMPFTEAQLAPLRAVSPALRVTRLPLPEGQRTPADGDQQVRRIFGVFFCKEVRGASLMCRAGKSSKLKKLDKHLDILNAPFLQPIFECFKGLYTRRLRGGQAFKQHYSSRPLICDRRSASGQEYQGEINKTYECAMRMARSGRSRALIPHHGRLEPTGNWSDDTIEY
jgi:hypothetical protein